MALTMGCARCHDHKFDPLEMSDYYALAGIFKSTQTMISHRVDSKWNTTGLGSIRAALRLDDLEQIIDRHDNVLVNGNPNRMPPGDREAHTELLEEAKKEYAAIPKAMAVVEGTAGDLEIFLRGNHLTRGPVVARRFPTILAGRDQPALDPKHSGRLELARWLTGAEPSAHSASDRQPGVAMAFRPGARQLGRQLRQAGAASDASRAARLAGESARFAGDGRSRDCTRRSCSRATYQMSTRWNRHAAAVDPENSLLWRMPRRRMEAEELRDSILAVSGLLDTQDGRHALGDLAVSGSFGRRARRASPSLYESSRRSVYLPVLRGALHEMFRTFDFPDPAVSSGDRAVTTVASQALFMMNSPMVDGIMSEARRKAARGRRMHRPRPARAGLPIDSRPARRAGGARASGHAFLERYRETAPSLTAQDCRAHAGGWPGRGSAGRSLSSNEFVYVE